MGVFQRHYTEPKHRARITQGPAWLETVLLIFVITDWDYIKSFALGMVTVALVTLVLFATFGAQILLAFPQLVR